MTTKTGMNEFDQILEDHDDNKLKALYQTCLEQLKQEQGQDNFLFRSETQCRTTSTLSNLVVGWMLDGACAHS